METIEEKLFRLIEPLCKTNNIYLHNIEIKGSHRNIIITVTVDTESGITLNICQSLSREISDLLEQKDFIEDNYRLEVTSPGIDKALEHPFEYRRNIGRDVKVTYFQDNTIKEFTGKLINYNEKDLTFEMERERIIIPLDKIKNVKIKLRW
jgi:ribosome maturation factor RimP